jgi:hypothetical protein
MWRVIKILEVIERLDRIVGDNAYECETIAKWSKDSDCQDLLERMVAIELLYKENNAYAITAFGKALIESNK